MSIHSRSPHSPYIAFLALAPLVAWAPVARAGEPMLYGHPDFYPSGDRPAQLRGDGSGEFPGATPVDSFDFRTKKNIVWACRLPGWGFSSPIVVGDKVFVTCDWNKLVCVDARTGKLLWTNDNHTFDIVGGGKADELRETFRSLTVPWLQAHAAMLERSYLEREIDLITAAREGRDLQPRPGQEKGRMQQRSSWGSNCPGDHLTKAETAALLQQARNVDDAALKRLQERYEALSARISQRELAPQTSGYVPTLSPYRRSSQSERRYKSEVKGRFALLHKHGIVFEIWNGWLGRSFSTPASDGEHVYAQFGQSQVVRYDLEGNRKWIKVFPEATGRNMRQNDSASPLIAGDKLIVLMGGAEHKPTAHTFIRALERSTGKELWSRRLDYVMTSHTFPNQTLVRVDGTDVIATSAGSILRAADGAVVMENLPAPIAPPLVVGNEVYLTCGYGQSNGQGSRMKITIERKGDEIVGNIHWAFLTMVIFMREPWPLDWP